MNVLVTIVSAGDSGL